MYSLHVPTAVNRLLLITKTVHSYHTTVGTERPPHLTIACLQDTDFALVTKGQVPAGGTQAIICVFSAAESYMYTRRRDWWPSG